MLSNNKFYFSSLRNNCNWVCWRKMIVYFLYIFSFQNEWIEKDSQGKNIIMNLCNNNNNYSNKEIEEE